MGGEQPGPASSTPPAIRGRSARLSNGPKWIDSMVPIVLGKAAREGLQAQAHHRSIAGAITTEAVIFQRNLGSCRSGLIVTLYTISPCLVSPKP